jgi:putative transposase
MRYPRRFVPGGTFFFTVVTQGRRPLRRQPFALEAIVVLPDHLHAMWSLPEGDADYPARWASIQRYVSPGRATTPASASQAAKCEKGVWQRRFWEHAIRDATGWRHHLDYIHFHPVKHGYCRSPEEWPYGAFLRMVARGSTRRTGRAGKRWVRIGPRRGRIWYGMENEGCARRVVAFDGHASRCPSYEMPTA